jgi:hypothetical protein
VLFFNRTILLTMHGFTNYEMNQNQLKYRLRDKQNRLTDTWMPVTKELILSGIQYREIVAIRRAIAWNLRRKGLTCQEIGAIYNQHPSTICHGLDKVD